MIKVAREKSSVERWKAGENIELLHTDLRH